MIPTFIKVSAGKRARYVPASQIVRLEADGCYTWLHAADGSSYLLSRNLRQAASQLPGFWRLHHSHMVNPVYVQGRTITGCLRLQTGHTLPVARRRRKTVYQLLDSRPPG